MLANRVRYLTGIFITGIFVTACGLIPNLSSDSKSNAEKAVLYMEMGINYMELDMLDTAKEKLLLALKYDSGNADIYNSLGTFYEHIKEYQIAEDYYQTAIRKGPEKYAVQSNVGRFYCERGAFNKGMELLQESIDQPMNNRQWFALNNMGICYAKQNDLVKAEEYLRQALRLQPEYAPALLEMQKISYENHQYMSARAFMERFLEVSKHTPESLWIAFQTERALGNSKAAEDYGEQYLNNFPTSKEADLIRTALGK